MTEFKCPFCGFVSRNPRDAEERYCVRCHVFVGDVLHASPMVRREMGRFFRRLAKREPERAEQHERAAEIWEAARGVSDD
jgi:GrpB-like predicted nucleotidyltransferase (UPF0157 family)